MSTNFLEEMDREILEKNLNIDLKNMWSWNKEETEMFQIPEMVIHRSYILLTSLLLIRNFKYPTAINPTLRNSIQLEWTANAVDEYYGFFTEQYFEFEVYEDKVSMLLAWEEPKNLNNLYDSDKVWRHFSCTFKDNEAENSYPMDIFKLFTKLEDMNEGNWQRIKDWFIEKEKESKLEINVLKERDKNV